MATVKKPSNTGDGISWRRLSLWEAGRRHIVPTAKTSQRRASPPAGVLRGPRRTRRHWSRRPSWARHAAQKADPQKRHRLDRRHGFSARTASEGRRLILPLRSPAADLVQPRAIPRWVGPGGVMPVKRTNAVTLTAIAPITEKTVCQVGDGIAIWAIPCVAL